MNKVLIINGPNLNMLGVRELDTYGSTSYKELDNIITSHSHNKVELEIYQSNIEGQIVSRIQQVTNEDIHGLIINPGAYTHTSIAIRDALAILDISIIEVHISDITKRETFRQVNLITDLCELTISGKGTDGYREAIDYLYGKK